MKSKIMEDVSKPVDKDIVEDKHTAVNQYWPVALVVKSANTNKNNIKCLEDYRLARLESKRLKKTNSRNSLVQLYRYLRQYIRRQRTIDTAKKNDI